MMANKTARRPLNDGTQLAVMMARKQSNLGELDQLRGTADGKRQC